jgi:hypothetical protein
MRFRCWWTGEGQFEMVIRVKNGGGDQGVLDLDCRQCGRLCMKDDFSQTVFVRSIGEVSSLLSDPKNKVTEFFPVSNGKISVSNNVQQLFVLSLDLSNRIT